MRPEHHADARQLAALLLLFPVVLVVMVLRGFGLLPETPPSSQLRLPFDVLPVPIWERAKETPD